MKTAYKNALIYNSDTMNFSPGNLVVEDGYIVGLNIADPDGCETVIDLGGAYLAPGLVDIHTHGRVSGDFISADTELLRKMLRSYLASGVTSLMPTFASATPDELAAATDRVIFLSGEDSIIEGIHLEGRYLNPKKRGAHAPELLATLEADELEGLIVRMQGSGKVLVSAALELDSEGSFTKRALSMGATLSLGHTEATYAEAMRAIDRGAKSFTHLFNTMPPLHHRDGGAVAAALTSAEVYAELIVDGFHVSPEMVKLAYMMKKERLVLITDSMEATGEPDGEYQIAGLPVTVKDGKARTHEGAIAGSTISLIDGVKNLSAFAGITFGEALYNATAAPARLIGIYDKVGSIEVGKRANMLVLDDEYKIETVILGGKTVK
jgi:N-acetylglucosamine-6-phosphate deacetylase